MKRVREVSMSHGLGGQHIPGMRRSACHADEVNVMWMRR